MADAGGREVVSVGTAVNGLEVAVGESAGEPAPPGAIGGIWVRGASVSAAYEGAGDPRRAGWVDTGDIGFMLEGELHVTGRRKEMLIVRGQNVYAGDVEGLARGVDGIGGRPVLALGVSSPQGEGLVLLATTRERDPDRRRAICDEIRLAVGQTLGVSVTDVVLVRPGELPRTSSGKLARHEGARLYAALRARQGQSL